jgi:hypothetical protein
MGGSARTFVMIGVAVVAAVAAPYIAPFIEAGLGAVGVDALGTTISLIQAGAAPEVAAGIASAVAPTVAGAVTGTVAGGTQAELAGGDVWEGAFQGALTGAVGGAVSSGVSSVLPSDLDPALKAAATGATRGFTSAQLKGSDLEKSLLTGALSGTTAGFTSAVFPSGFLGEGQYDEQGNLIEGTEKTPTYSTAERLARGIGGAYISQNLSSLFAPDAKSTGGGTTPTASTRGYSTPTQTYAPTGQTYQVGTAPTYTPSSVTTTGESGTAPGSSALAQALRIGDPGSSIESPASDAPQQNVWNLASLRVKDETGSEV